MTNSLTSIHGRDHVRVLKGKQNGPERKRKRKGRRPQTNTCTSTEAEMKVGRAGARLEPRAHVGGGGEGRRRREGQELNWTGKEEPSDQTKTVWH